MSEIAIGATQYGDLTGTISVDGHEGDFLRQLAKQSDMPEEYYPVGLSLYTEHPGSHDPHISILAVDQSAVEAAGGSVASYAAQWENVPVFKFRVRATAAELLALIKRVSIYVAIKVLSGKTLKIMDDR